MAALVQCRSSCCSRHAYNGARARQILDVSVSTSRSARAPSRSAERRERLTASWISGSACREPARAPALRQCAMKTASRFWDVEAAVASWRPAECPGRRAWRRGDAMQLREMPPERHQSRRPVGARGGKPLEFGQRRLGIAAADRISEIIESRLGGIADDRLDVLGLDALAALRIEGKLDHLRPRQSLVGAEPRHEIVARLPIDAETRLCELGVDQPEQRFLVAVAGQRDGALMRLEHFAQTRVGPEIASLDDQDIVRRRGEQRLE